MHVFLRGGVSNGVGDDGGTSQRPREACSRHTHIPAGRVANFRLFSFPKNASQSLPSATFCQQVVLSTTLQSMMNAKLSQQRF